MGAEVGNFGVGYNNSTTQSALGGGGGNGLNLGSYLTDSLVKNISGIDNIFGGGIAGGNTGNQFGGLGFGSPQSYLQQGGSGALGQQGGGFFDFFKNAKASDYLNSDFLLGTDKNVGLLPAVGGIAQTVGGLYNANKQFNFGKSQYEDQKKIFNNQQERLQTDSLQRAKDVLSGSSFDDNWSQDQRDEYIKGHTTQPKFI